MLEEAEATCPYCWETIPLLLDLSGGSQTYVEDCSVCCQPIVVRLEVDEGADEDAGGGRYRIEVAAEDD